MSETKQQDILSTTDIIDIKEAMQGNDKLCYEFIKIVQAVGWDARAGRAGAKWAHENTEHQRVSADLMIESFDEIEKKDGFRLEEE